MRLAVARILAVAALTFTAGAAGTTGDPAPKGALRARPARALLEAWAHKSLWITNPAGLSGTECFDFHDFKDCSIWNVDGRLRLSRKGGRFCDVLEFTVDHEPGHVPGDYGLIIGGIGSTYTVSFPSVVTAATRSFAQRDEVSGWIFEIFDGPCTARAAR
jgi:hypothetical protein